MPMLTSYFVRKQKSSMGMEDVFLSLSKGKGLSDESPVFDLWIYKNGHILYNGIENVEKKGKIKSSIPFDILNRIEEIINDYDSNDIGEIKGRDNPLNMMKFNGKKIVYQSNRLQGNLLELNNLLELIAENI